MAEQARRRWFQIHLSTGIGLMFAAGVIVWANMQPVQFIPDWADSEPAEKFGWPATAATKYSAYAMGSPSDVIVPDYGGIFIDALTALAILAATAVACEWLSRPRRVKP